jgi:hypothetical protein
VADRPRPAVAAVSAILLFAGASFAGVQFAAPTPGYAANGLFLWTDGSSGLVNAIPFPPREKCFGTFKANAARNYTDSDAVLSRDGLCFDVLTVVKAGQSYDGEFGSVGFTPPGATKARQPG